MKITLIGSGNVATYFAFAFKDKGHTILQVYSQHILLANELAERVQAAPCATIEELSPDADIYLIAITDDALKPFTEKLRLKNKIVVHTSGFHSIDVLKNVSSKYGVFYPLQTLNKKILMRASPYPIFIEASDDDTLHKLISFAEDIDCDVNFI